MIGKLSLATLALVIATSAPAPAIAQSGPDAPPAKANVSNPAFEFFRLAPGKTEDFIRSVAIWDQVNVAGGQPKTQVYLHEDGEGWDVMLYKAPRPAPTPAQNAAMAAKIKELGLPSGPLYFVTLREKVADHAHFVATGPVYAENWVAELDGQRAAMAKAKK
jgi:hypothetical protein